MSTEEADQQPVRSDNESETKNDDDTAAADKLGDESDTEELHQSLNSKWEDSFNRLLNFKEKHGHCLVPNRYPEDPHLGSWVSTQRRQYKTMLAGSGQSTPMTPARARRLEEIGFLWSTKDPRHVPWERRYQEIIDFQERFGHSQVPIGWKENVQLSNWVSTQRQEYKLMQKGRNTRLTPERINLLDKINFVWEAQRGGPRRQQRATVSVPESANPAQQRSGSGRAHAKGRGGMTHHMMMPAGFPMMPFAMPPGMMMTMPRSPDQADGNAKKKQANDNGTSNEEEQKESGETASTGVNSFFHPQMMMAPQMMSSMGWPGNSNGQMAFGIFPFAAPFPIMGTTMSWPQTMTGAPAEDETNQGKKRKKKGEASENKRAKSEEEGESGSDDDNKQVDEEVVATEEE